ncbi:PPOX class F420-dependent oxidoreductase [Haloechinothrix sp. YIM 98757]|uniref:PPOX class F420-dependent oxidoreductase n=1 Tax=Haloechinothrix aidingensis TaxID=2752311 RepID=A0A838ABL4_9PSEU|nr:PPOX class F420-dependent oxidoreductase [Haloechinothrix aidingensis]MBA0126621.1 PPOX class F420-dependent oxidoreductase [Haloechinothrix aidingensis]
MSAFSDAERAFLAEGGKLGHLATVDEHGQPHNVPLGWTYNADLDTIDIGGHDFARTRKFRNVQGNPLVCFVVDDVLPPWRPRAVQVRGRAEALPAATPYGGGGPAPMIRITPARVVSWSMEHVDA